MIPNDEIEAKATEFGVRPLDVQKDYVYGWLLNGVFQRPALESQLILKGGNALRKGYLPDTRFSKDLDFSARQAITQELLDSELREVRALVASRTGIEFVDQMVVREKHLPIADVDALEVRLYFKSFYGEENLSLKTQLDITQFDRIYLPVQSRTLLHPYSDREACTTMISCHKLEEILASKLTTLLHRRKPVDLFDLLYAIVFRDQFGVNRREVVTTFLRKSIFEGDPIGARELLRGIGMDSFRDLWTSITAPVGSLFNYDYVVTNFQVLIDSLFELIPPPAIPARRLAPGLGTRAAAIQGIRYYFPLDIRNTIINAGRTRTMVQLIYDGYQRLVEPYKLEFNIRKSDGRGLEYFWGWDASGGKSGKVGIKQFICQKIQSVTSTSITFQPRYPVGL
jgi:predicted nucleotidyltransferase component of viral defense system